MTRYTLTTGERIPPTWHCLFTAPQRERTAREHLRANGVYAFYPSRERLSHRHGKTYAREVPEVSGYVFAQFRYAPDWFALKERRRLITGVMCSGGRPIVFPREIIQDMHGMTVEAKKLEEARKELLRVRPGDKARITEGPLAGFMVDVTDICGGEAILDGLIGRAKADLNSLERIIPNG